MGGGSIANGPQLDLASNSCPLRPLSSSFEEYVAAFTGSGHATAGLRKVSAEDRPIPVAWAELWTRGLGPGAGLPTAYGQPRCSEFR